MVMKKLNRTTAKATLERPVKIVQFGEGNFLRGFVDWMVDILNEKSNFNGAINIVQPRTSGRGDRINTQEGLYHTWLVGLQDGQEINETRLITSVKGLIDPFKDYQAFLSLADNENLRFIISNTTEAGIVYDMNDTDYTNLPKTFPGKLTALLFKRFTTFEGAPDKGCIILPVELIEKNGDTLKKAVINYIALWKLPEGFLNWIEDHNFFCNTLVDRIVPGYPNEEEQHIKARLGYEDELIVKAEPFHLWVIEAPDPVQKELPFAMARLNVKFVEDLTPYRIRKVMILNGAHTAMVAYGYLSGRRTVKECLEKEPMASFVGEIIFEEILPTLNLPKAELISFAKNVLERFQNPYIRHELLSIALNSISKFRVRVLPSILKYYELNDKLPENLVKAFAALIVFYKGNYGGREIPLKDDPSNITFMSEVWKGEDLEVLVSKILSNTDFWNQDLTTIPGLEQQLLVNITLLLTKEHN